MSLVVLCLAFLLLKDKPDFDISLNNDNSRAEVEAIPLYETFSTQFKKVIINKNLIVLAIISGQA